MGLVENDTEHICSQAANSLLTCNPLLHDNTFNTQCTMYLKILWKIEHLLSGLNAPFSIIFSKLYQNVSLFFSMVSKNRNGVMI